jgi:type IV secretion system protein VirD4
MESFFGDLLKVSGDYWWVIAVAAVLSHFLTQGNPLEQAIDNFKPKNAHGGAALADNKALRKAGLFRGKGVPIGYTLDGKELHYGGQGHLLTVAAARMGKGATLLVNALLSWLHGAIIIDPKCENALITAHFRRRLGPVYILNPFRMFARELKGMHARFNPMDMLDAASLSFHANCDKLAAALVWDEGQEGKYFTDGARILVSGIIAALMRHGPACKRNLVTVAQIIGSGDGLFTFCREAMQSSDPFIRSKLERFALAEGKEPSREMGDVTATGITNLGFVNNAAIAESLVASDFRFADVRKRRATVFICLPLSKLDICDKYFRLILETALAELLNEGTQS